MTASYDWNALALKQSPIASALNSFPNPIAIKNLSSKHSAAKGAAPKNKASRNGALSTNTLNLEIDSAKQR